VPVSCVALRNDPTRRPLFLMGHNSPGAGFVGNRVARSTGGFMGILLAAFLTALRPQDPKLSGPQPGEKTPGFQVFDLGSRRELDYVADAKGGPTVLIFIHELTRPGGALMRALDENGRIKEARGLRTLF